MDIWQIITIISLAVAIVAFLIATPPFTQMIWGRPKIKVFFEEFDYGLACYLGNEPIAHGILQVLCITRMPVQDLSVNFIITNKDKTPIFSGLTDRRISYSDTLAHHISLPPSTNTAGFGIVKIEGTKVYPCKEKRDIPLTNEEILHAGVYQVLLLIYVDGRETRKTKDFVVSRNKPYAYWAKSENEL